jgi:hypothetical protein
MKLDAHPLVVAVALGLLGPAALASEDEDEGAAHASSPPEGSTTETEWSPGPPPDADEFHRVEIEWLKAR